jgi:TPR repeat protein
MKWYRVSAAQRNAEAQLKLGSMYQEGRGVTSNFLLSHMWFNLAAAQGIVEASGFRDMVAARMTAQQISQAQELARRCEISKYKNCS